MQSVPPVEAIASAGKFCEMALTYSHKAYTFMSAFNQSEKHAILLQSRLQEVNVLMRDLQRYVEKLKKCPPTESNDGSPALYSILEISKQFADDMICLNDLIPYDIVTLSASVRKRTKFVLREKETKDILQRLDARKASATLALELIGRINDLGLQHDMVSVQSEMQRLLSQQNALQISHAEQHDEAVAQSRLHESNVLSAIQALNSSVTTNGEESARQQGALAEGLFRNLSEIQAQISEILVRQNSILSSQKVQVAAAHFEASDAGLLVGVMRHELKQQLKPLYDQIGREHIDRVVDAFFTKIVESRLFEDDPILIAKNKDTRMSNMPNPEQQQGGTVVKEMRSTSPLNSHTSIRARKIVLFSTSHRINTRFGVLIFRLKKYRNRTPGTPANHVYFTLAVDILPQLRICSRGFSAIYSSGPDIDGYQSIFPSISIINIIPYSSEAHILIARDDLKNFRILLEQGNVGVWDKVQNGLNLLEVAMVCKAPFISQYLLCQSGYGEQLVERGSGFFAGCWDVFAASSINAELEVLADILVHLKSIESQLVQQPTDPQLAVASSLGWLFRRSKTTETICSSQVRSTRISSVRLLGEFGRVIHPFDTGLSEDLMDTISFMDIYLGAGGNPNTPTRDGDHPLLAALLIIYYRVGRDPDDDAELDDDTELDDDDSTLDCKARGYRDCDYKTLWLAVELLTMLISAGADVYHFRQWYQCGHYAILSDIALDLDIDDIWEAALLRCGMDPTEVDDEAERRLDQHLKLHGASRTTVDVEPIVDQPSTSGLRRRQATAYTEI